MKFLKGLTLCRAAVPRLPNWGHHHDIPEAPDRLLLAAFLHGVVPLGRPLEEHPTVDVVGQEDGLLQGYPTRVRNPGDLGENLGPRVTPPITSTRLPAYGSGRS